MGRLSLAAENRYDVALSFAGEQRPYVERVAKALSENGLAVFYDAYEQANLWGKNLYDHLADVYQNQASYVVIFASADYERKAWTTHERQSAQARALQEKHEYVLPARFDDTPIPGVPDTVGYVDLRRLEPEELAELILQKVGAGNNEPPRRGPGQMPGTVSETGDAGWCQSERREAIKGLAATSKTDYYAVCASIDPPLAVERQKDLVTAVRDSNIETFGWPIGVVVPGQGAPHPTVEGIAASTTWEERSTYDCWTLTRSGRFHLLRALSEDALGSPESLFFNTRVVRVAETVLFLAGLYERLGADESAVVHLAVEHVGLDHRPLTAAGPRRATMVRTRRSQVNALTTQTTFRLGDATGTLVTIVKALLGPLFSLYEFFELSDEVYADLVEKFMAGKVT